jgi:hypothetical protein
MSTPLVIGVPRDGATGPRPVRPRPVRPPVTHTTRLVAGLAATALTLAACATEPEPATAPDGAAGGLAGVCPDPVVVQSPWWPQSEHGVFYHLVGEGYTVDPDALSVTGPLVAAGEDTGVRIEIRAGGPAIGFANAGTQMYADESILLGQVATDDAIGMSAETPVVAVMAPMDIAPYMIMWDPERFPQFNTVVDIGRTDTTVLYFDGATYMDYLVGSGILRAEQVDGGYDGSPARWLAEGGNLAQQGFATSEPYVYEHELAEWGRPVRFQLIHHTGYPIYPEAVVVRADQRDRHAPCLQRLVPILQRSLVDYLRDPAATNDLIVELTDAYGAFPYSAEKAAWAVEQQLELDIVGNGGNGTIGDFDLARVQETIDIVAPIYAGQRREIRDGLAPEDLVTNEFIDESIALP